MGREKSNFERYQFYNFVEFIANTEVFVVVFM